MKFIIATLAAFVILFPTVSLAQSDEQRYESNTSATTGNDTAYASRFLAQTFTTLEAHDVTRVRIPVLRTEDLSWARLEIRRASGSPAEPQNVALESVILTSAYIGSNITVWSEFEFISPVSLEADTEYALVLTSPMGTFDDYILWQYTSTAYSGGAPWVSTDGGVSWSAGGGDHLFEIYGTPNLEILSANVFSDYAAAVDDESTETGDWLVAIHYRNEASPYFEESTPQSHFRLQLLQGENLLTNGNFEYGDPPDSWVDNAQADSTAESTIVKAGSQSIRTVIDDGGGAGSSSLNQTISGTATDYADLTLTFGIWVYASSANDKTHFLRLGDGVGFTDSASIAQDDAWHWVTVTRTVDSSPTSIQVALVLKIVADADADDVVYSDDAWLIVGGSLVPGGVLAESVPRIWGSKPGSIYINSSEAAGLQWAPLVNHYYVRILGNYGSWPSGLYEIQDADWSGAILSRLDEWAIAAARRMGDHDQDDSDYYITTISGRTVLASGPKAGEIFSTGIPGLAAARGEYLMEVYLDLVNIESDEDSPLSGIFDMNVQLGPEIVDVAEGYADLVNLPTRSFIALVLLFAAVSTIMLTPHSYGNAAVIILVMIVGGIGLIAGVVEVAYAALAGFLVFVLAVRTFARGI